MVELIPMPQQIKSRKPSQVFVSRQTAKLVLEHLSSSLKAETIAASSSAIRDARQYAARDATAEVCRYVATLELSEPQRGLFRALWAEMQMKLSSNLQFYVSSETKEISVRGGMVIVPRKIAIGKEKLLIPVHGLESFTFGPKLGRACLIGAAVGAVCTCAYLAAFVAQGISPQVIAGMMVASVVAGIGSAIAAGLLYSGWALLKNAWHATKDPSAMAQALDAAVKNLLWGEAAQ